MTLDQKQTHWKQHIEAWQESDISQRVYCEQHALSLASFGYWRTRLKKVIATNTKLRPVKILHASHTVNLFLPAGVRLDVPIDSLAEILPIVYRTVQALP